MSELLRLSLTELEEHLRARRVSACELMDATLARLDATHERLNAAVARGDPDALRAAAREADERFARGTARPLEGIPLGVKDLEDVEGWVTTQGSALFADARARADSVQVARLRAAGAIPVAKTNTPELGYTAITFNRLFGYTRNPWNLSRTPAGSSGGSAALLAGGVLALVTASDGGGSIRLPASCVGAFGLKPSYGRVPETPRPLAYYGDTQCLGPLTRTVEDAALVLDQTAGASARDPDSLPHPGYSYRERLREGLSGALRIAYSPDLGYAVVQSDVAAGVEDAVRELEKLGHRVEQIAGGPPSLGEDWFRWTYFEMLAQLTPHLARAEAEIGRELMRRMHDSDGYDARRFHRLVEGRGRVYSWMNEVFERFDLLLTPTLPFDPPPVRGPFPSETEGRPQPEWAMAAFTVPFNFARVPAASVRAGLSRAGLPIGMQIVGPRLADDRVLLAARAFERARPWHPYWPHDEESKP
jgi:aspartyl-tRNA(Asn)/glutamyl-tRNA(Gln) amidotransferase subunit A